MSTFDETVIAEFRANGGQIGGSLAGTPIMLLRHVGARSGIEHVTPVAYTARPDGTFLIVASNGGSPTHPAWYHNLKAHPRIDVEVGTKRFPAVAVELEGTARADAWPSLIAAAPSIGDFQAQTTRRIPVFVVTSEEPAATRRCRPAAA